MITAGQLVAFVALQSFIAFGWWRFVRARAMTLSSAEALLCTGILYFAQIIGTSLVLGWGGVLARGPLLILNLVCSTAVLLIARGSPGAVGTAHRCGLPLGKGTVRLLNIALLILLSVVTTRVLLRGGFFASTDWDGLAYHLPMAALMLQTHQLALGPVHNPVIAAYPKNIEIWSHWILSFFGHDRWVDLAQVPFLLLAMLATYCIARRLGSSRATSAAGTLFLPFCPVVLTQITTAYTDVALTALVLSAVALLLVTRADRSSVVALSFGCALGLLIGTKFSGALFAGLFLGAFAAVRGRVHGRSSVPAVASVVVAALLLGGDSYVRNWRLHGNPVFPYRTSVMNVELPGLLDPARVYGIAQTRNMHPVARIWHSWSAVNVVNYTGIFGGFGVTWPFLGLVSVVSLALSIRSRDAARLAVFALFVALFLVTPLNFRVRFVIYLLGLGCVSFSHLLDRVTARPRALMVSAALLVAVVSTYQVWRHDSRTLRWADPERMNGCTQGQPPYLREAYLWVRRHAPAGSTILVFRGPDGVFPYCLWNPSFSNRVEFADATSRRTLYDVAMRRPGTILFLPHRAEAYKRYATERSDRWRELFSNADVTLATVAGTN